MAPSSFFYERGSKVNFVIIGLTFLSVNLDFFFMLLFLVRKYRLSAVLSGYLLGTLLLVTASYLIGQTLSAFLPEWLLGVLGFLPIYLAIKDDDDEVNATQSGASAVGTVLVTYLSVCTGCNLAIFLPVLMHAQLAEFFVALLLILGLSAVAVLAINLLSKNSFVSQVMEKYGEKLMKVCYVLIGLYVFWDSGLVAHLIRLVG